MALIIVVYLLIGSFSGFWISLVAQKTKRAANPNVPNFQIMCIGITVFMTFLFAWPIAGSFCIYKMIDRKFGDKQHA